MKVLRYLSVCSGFGGAELAFAGLSWQCAAVAEIDPAACAVLEHRYPDVPNLGDFTKIGVEDVGAIDLLVGGTPCQDFSVAGLRAGMAGDRGQLTIEFARLAERLRPRWLVWENVPGVLSSDGGRAFGTFLGILGKLGYGIAYRVLDAQYFGVPQRRRRVFVVGCLGDWRSAAAVLFERDCLSGNNPPRREAGKRVAGPVAAGAPSRRNGGSNPTADQFVEFPGQYWDGTDTADTLDASNASKQQAMPEKRRFQAVVTPVAMLNMQGSKSNSIAQEDGPSFTLNAMHGHDVHAIAYGIDEEQNAHEDQMGCLKARTEGGGFEGAVAFESRFARNGRGAPSEVVPPLKAQSGQSGRGDGAPMVCFDTTQVTSPGNYSQPKPGDACHPLASGAHPPAIAGMQVRRLTPVECERLQGVPPGHTQVPYRGKPMADGPRYKMIGNGFAIPCVKWIGERIQMVEELP